MRTAVVGVGYLGRFHAQKYAVVANSELVGIADPSPLVREAVAKELGVAAYADHRELLGRVDAVSIVTPTPQHFSVAKEFLEAGAHVLVEKPMTTTVEEGEALIEAARRANRILQVGHLERFNAAVRAVQPILTTPRFIESARLAPFKHRGTDVDVVLDLMIHDIDLILSIVRSPVVAVDAIGTSVFSKEIDIAMLAYNLVRAVICLASQQTGLEPRRFSFTRVRNVVNAFGPLMAAASTPQESQQCFEKMMYYVRQAKLPQRTRKRASYPRAVWPKPHKYPKRKA